jgi:hypothetical protein
MKTETTEIKIYIDTGADISRLEKMIPSNIKFYQFPYDSDHRPKKRPLLAEPSELQIQDGYIDLIDLNELSNVSLGDCEGSFHFSKIEAIIGKGPQNRRDVLHFDSAYKTGCKIFLTSDKKDICSKKEALEALTGIKTLNPSLELDLIVLTIKNLTEKI